MTESLPTQLLIQQVQNGDHGALEELCARYRPRVLAAVKKTQLSPKLRNKLGSSDIVQEVMIDAFRKVDSFDYATEGAFMKYLNRVIKNRIRDEADRWTTKKRNVDREISQGMRSSGSGTPLIHMEDRTARTPSSIVSLGEDLEKLMVAMDRLADQSEAYRDLIIAVMLEGQTYQEIADETGSTPDSVRMRVGRAKLALAKIYMDLEKGR